MTELVSTASCTISAIVFWRTCSTPMTASNAACRYRSVMSSWKTLVAMLHHAPLPSTPTAADCRCCPSSSTTRRPSPTSFTNSKKRFILSLRSISVTVHCSKGLMCRVRLRFGIELQHNLSFWRSDLLPLYQAVVCIQILKVVFTQISVLPFVVHESCLTIRILNLTSGASDVVLEALRHLEAKFLCSLPWPRTSRH